MRVLAACVVALCLAVTPAMAGANGDGGNAAANSPAPSASSANGNSPAPAKPETVTTESDLQQLKDLVEAQSKQLQEQQQELQEQKQEMQSLKQQLGSGNSTASALAAAPVVAPPSAAIGPVVGALTASAAISSATPKPALAQAADQPKLGPIATQDFKIGVTFYGGWSYYNSTGYGQQFMDTPTNQVAPGNDGYNTFEINRAYVNFLYTPNDHVALRVTPDIYRNSDGSYVLRLKYGYVDFQNMFGAGAFKSTKITFGQTQQPLTDWQEGLSGYRYTYLTPWNYLSLSSTYVGAKIHGPITSNGKEYLDYDLGVFNNNSFHAVELNETKAFMVRGTVYPFGTTADRTGLGFTFFNDFGYKPALPAATQTSLDRLAAIAFYQTHSKSAQIAFEYDWGHNAYSTGNLFNGAGTPTGAFAGLATAATAALAGDTHQQGYDVFGHLRLGKSSFALWGLYQYFKPNTDYNFRGAGFTANPIDFARTAGGISYSVTKQFDVAFGDENFHWAHPQTVTTGGDTNGIVIWTQFNY
ncbi:MAG TPA: hypothetical protein VJS43_04025 [Candidatus Acidoferrales bacterium]|nr:hypothetical protein [Candidatus Acidoferrales bacterium]